MRAWSLGLLLCAASPALGAETFDFGAPAAGVGNARTITIDMQAMHFVPGTVTVRAGETVRFLVENKSDTDHEFVLGSAALQKAHRAEMIEMAAEGPMSMDDDPNAVSVPAHAKKTLAWHFTRPGTIEYACDMPGHYEGGMHGTIVVK